MFRYIITRANGNLVTIGSKDEFIIQNIGSMEDVKQREIAVRFTKKELESAERAKKKLLIEVAIEDMKKGKHTFYF